MIMLIAWTILPTVRRTVFGQNWKEIWLNIQYGGEG